MNFSKVIEFKYVNFRTPFQKYHNNLLRTVVLVVFALSRKFSQNLKKEKKRNIFNEIPVRNSTYNSIPPSLSINYS